MNELIQTWIHGCKLPGYLPGSPVSLPDACLLGAGQSLLTGPQDVCVSPCEQLRCGPSDRPSNQISTSRKLQGVVRARPADYLSGTMGRRDGGILGGLSHPTSTFLWMPHALNASGGVGYDLEE